MKSEMKTGAALATAVAFLLGSVPAHAADKPADTAKKVKCAGGNACKSKGECKSADNTCGGKNGCKGKGWVMSDDAASCSKAGGKVVASK